MTSKAPPPPRAGHLLTDEQRVPAVEIMQLSLVTDDDRIVLTNSMKILGKWAGDDELRSRLRRRADPAFDPVGPGGP